MTIKERLPVANQNPLNKLLINDENMQHIIIYALPYIFLKDTRVQSMKEKKMYSF